MPPKDKRIRARAFCITVWTDEILEKLKYEARGAEYCVAGREKCPTTGKVHYQSYIRFPFQRDLNALRKLLPGTDVQMRRGHDIQASDYCFKDEDLVFESGERISQGQRTDIEKLRDEVVAGKTVEDIAIENPSMYHQYGRTLSKIEDIQMRKKFRTEMTEGVWFIGETGAGKSHKCFEGFTPDTHYVYPYDGDWCDGYRQQEVMILNEFRGQIAYSRLLEFVDKWPVWVRRRGREPMPFLSKKVIVTSKMHPRDVFKNLSEHDTLDQLIRRFKIFEVGRDYLGNRSFTEVM